MHTRLLPKLTQIGEAKDAVERNGFAVGGGGIA